MGDNYTIWDKIFNESGDEQKAWNAYNNADKNLRDLDIFENGLNWFQDTDKFNSLNNAFSNLSQNNQFHFRPDQASFVNEEEEAGKLDQLADYLKQSGDKIALNGYIANVNNMYPNETLSQERADTIKNQLVNRGVDASMIDPTVGKGTGQFDNSFWNPENRYVEAQLTAPNQENYYTAEYWGTPPTAGKATRNEEMYSLGNPTGHPNMKQRDDMLKDIANVGEGRDWANTLAHIFTAENPIGQAATNTAKGLTDSLASIIASLPGSDRFVPQRPYDAEKASEYNRNMDFIRNNQSNGGYVDPGFLERTMLSADENRNKSKRR